MAHLILPTLLILAGGYFLFRNIVYLRDDAKLKAYLHNSPKASLWIKKFGLEKTVELSKRYFLPIGILFSLALLGIASWSLLRIIQNQSS